MLEDQARFIMREFLPVFYHVIGIPPFYNESLAFRAIVYVRWITSVMSIVCRTTASRANR
jgi:hypothetical protein